MFAISIPNLDSNQWEYTRTDIRMLLEQFVGDWRKFHSDFRDEQTREKDEDLKRNLMAYTCVYCWVSLRLEAKTFLLFVSRSVLSRLVGRDKDAIAVVQMENSNSSGSIEQGLIYNS